jgi:ankyrin repeat protein
MPMPKRPESPQVETSELFSLMQAIVRNDASEVAMRLENSPSLAREPLILGATREVAADFFFEEINHYLYAGDTPLHAAAAGYRIEIARMLLQNGATVTSRNRRGAEPLHYAADGGPGSPHWNPEAQAATILLLIQAGANPNALDKTGVAPLHRAVRQRCPAAVDSLLKNGADVLLKNKSGTTPLRLAVLTTGRGGSGTPEAKVCQQQIIELLLAAGADPQDLKA